MIVVRAEEKEWSEKEGYSKKVFLTDADLKQPGIHVQEIKIKPNETAKNHYHKKQTEIFYFLNNNGYFIVNGRKIDVRPGDIIVVQPMDEHEVVNNTDSDFLYMAYKFNYDAEDLYWG